MYQRGVIAFDLEFKGDVEEFFDCKQDKTTPEILDLAIRGHKAALLKIIDFFIFSGVRPLVFDAKCRAIQALRRRACRLFFLSF